ncbi:MAG: hypothetical protein H6608_12330 [Flavobacteriales bacterium]|nr:hypothetical protein [Bacteroidota bacterium]MCB9241918.1 hypothetical protein [Flavobacteriales bacterium]
MYHKRLIWKLVPIMGIAAFFIIYLLAASLYPGGSAANPSHEGFDWVHNYWCDLMNPTGANGEINPARSLAISGMTMLCISLGWFFYLFASTVGHTTLWRRTIKSSGTASMAVAAVVFTDLHNQAIIISSLFGLITLIGILVCVFNSKLTAFKVTGALVILILISNNVMYYSGLLIEYLPLVQKLSFAIVLLWIAAMNIALIRYPSRNV